MDTLAGIALKYNVSVADIKRANGLLSDSALYGRSTLKIPTKLIPLGEELQVIFAQVASGFGRDPVLNAEANLQPASAAVARVARTLNIINGESYPPEYPGDTPWWCQCGTCDEDEDGPAACRSRRITGSSGGDVELIERTLDGQTLMSPPGSSGGPTRLHARMRRRRGHTADSPDDGGGGGGLEEEEDTDEDGPRQRWGPGRPPRPHNHLHRNGTSAQGPGQAMQSFFSNIGKAFGESAVVKKIKAAASQPALTSAHHSLSEAADGVLNSMREGLLSRRSAGPSSNPGLGPGAVPMLPRSYNAAAQAGNGSTHARSHHKAGGKDD